jgi:hypothetical protein
MAYEFEYPPIDELLGMAPSERPKIHQKIVRNALIF